MGKPSYSPGTDDSPAGKSLKALIEGWSWHGTVGVAQNVSYSFTQATGFSDRWGLTGQGTLNGTQQTLAENAFQAWANVANVTFTKTTGLADINVRQANMPDAAGWMAATTYAPNVFAHVDVVMDRDYTDFNAGTYSYMALMHEIGHALGLKHPGNYNGSSGKGSGTFLPASVDTRDISIMSYHDGIYSDSWTHNPTTPMLLDIAAIQFLYGANHSYMAGDDTYSLTGSNSIYTIWDGAGIDTLSAASTSTNNVLDLREGISNVNIVGSSTVWIAFGANIENAVGGSGNDLIYGNLFANTLTGNNGNDTIFGDKGNDTIFGGAGSNKLDGGEGNDIFTVIGADTVVGGKGDDVVDASADNSATRIDGGDGNDNLTGGNATDNIVGGKGNDALDGGASNDTLNGGADNDDISGGAGNDSIIGDVGNDTVNAGDGNDLINGGAGNDSLYGGIGNDRLLGEAGNDTMDGGDGNDTLDGGAGNDIFYGGLGDDYFISNAGNDTLTGDGGGDVFAYLAKAGKDTITDFEGAGDAVGDIIQISSSLLKTIDAVLAKIVYTDEGDAYINLGKSSSITLIGVSGLNASDFAIV